MGIFGKGWLGDLGKTIANNAISPLEAVTGQNLYDPELEADKHRGYSTAGIRTMNNFNDSAAQVAGAVLPSALDMAAPGTGTALNMARNVTPLMGDATTKGPQGKAQGIAGLVNLASMFSGGLGQAGAGAGTGEALGSIGGQVGEVPSFNGFGYTPNQFTQNTQLPGFRMPLGGPIPYGNGGDMTGPNLAAFNGPTHEEGGIPFNGQAEIEKKETVDMNEKFVYSDRLKVPGKKITFAEASKKFKGTDKDDDITRNTNKLMLDKLKSEQETLKQEAFAKDQAKFLKKHGGYIKEYLHGGYLPDPNMRGGVQYGSRSNYGGAGVNYGGGNTTYMANGGFLQNDTPGARMSNQLAGIPGLNIPGQGLAYEESLYSNAPVVNPNTLPVYSNAPQPNFEGTENYLNAPQGLQQGNPFEGLNINQAMQFLPAGYALTQGMQGIEEFNPNINPEYDAAIDLVAGRRYDAKPEMDQALRTRNTAFKGVRDASGGNAAVELNNLKGAQILSDRAIRQSLANENNQNNLYKMQEAGFRAQLGQEKSNALNQAQLYDMQARAARDSFTQKGFDAAGQQGNLNQTNQIYQQLIDAGYGDLLNGDLGKIARGKNRKKKSKK